jgi:hypothetical protein
VARWDAMFGAGVRSHLIANKGALPLMLRRQHGLIVLTQERPGDTERFGQNIVVDRASAATVGWVRTVNRGTGFDASVAGLSEDEVVALTQSPHLIGRAIAMLAGDLARAYDFTDLDGRFPTYEGGA